MPNTKISALPADITLADDDLMVVVDVDDPTMAASGTNKKITAVDIAAYIASGLLASDAETITGAATDKAVTPAGLYAKLPHPDAANAGAHFDPRLSLYNWKPSNTMRLRKALSIANSGGHGKVAFVGDSITAAVPNGAPGDLEPFRDAYPYQLVEALAATGMTIAGEGPVYANNNSAFNATDSRWVIDANWQFILPHQLLVFATFTGATATFTSTRPGTVVEVHYPNSGGPFNVVIDGGAPTLITPGVDGVATVWTSGVLADRTHTVTITTTTAGITWLLGVAVRRTSGLSIINASLGGAPTSYWTPDPDPIKPKNHVEAAAPTATFIMLEANDVGLATAPATYTSQLTAIVTWAKLLGDVVLLVSPPMDTTVYPDKVDYDPLIYAVAEATDVPLIDLEHHFTNWAVADALGLFVDDAHPARYTHADIAQHLTQILAPAGAGVVPANPGLAIIMTQVEWDDPGFTPEPGQFYVVTP